MVGTVLLLIRPDAAPVRAPMTSEPVAVKLLLDGAYGARFAGELAASKQGYFSSRIELAAQPDLDFVQTIAHQHAIGVTSGQKFLLASWRGVPVTAFAASFLDTSVAIFTLESSGLRRPIDLIGKRVGYRRASEGEVVFDAMMAQLRLPRSQITKVPDRDSFDALRAGEADAIIAAIDEQPDPSSPTFAKLNVIKPQDYGIHVPGQVYFASNDLIHDQPSVIADVLQGLIRGWQFAYGDYARSVPVLAGAGPARLNSERLRFELQQQRPLVLPTGGRIGDYDESRWRTLRDILLFAKLGEEDVPLAKTVNYQFLRDVYRRSPDLAAPGAWSGEK
ncbi:nitrate ABC transporter substrate-binding protein [Bradyrhizobium canariense]|uniref:Thiamine pyrimidine synthase n=2 Tax=Bradyrhizobium canariense TaxID=255045 RepID=A0A1X3FQN3_9BRAD|nr:nitrate ABC transporter substrate-binding protein [Bradyrhizobium canariense]OSI79453.1 nitrate ABC transporter substrate-binding protein [Bradyrhizobium canariense]OSI89699.1 nitrate ABC transporter substrate-binding protein [Bradyrhizobium canariense]OSI91074.1 nitrate ABC transporter substrate-binding protein [Bradyrhizobium canariense]OSJ04091.1 nitrate ABC transporter substrate-binding protein [Bradyrhizobium canariense]